MRMSLEGLKLLAGNNMIMNVDNHDAILSLQTNSSLSETAVARQDSEGKIGVMEYWSSGVLVRTDRPILHYSNIPSLHWVLLGGRNIKLSTAEVASAAPKIANDRP